MDVSQYITQNALILIPVLYIIGMIIKNTDKISDKYIPLILLVFGIAGSMGIIGVHANAVIQGVLVTGATVYTNQPIKQTGKDK